MGNNKTEKRELIKSIFSDIEKAIKKTTLPTPVPINNSKLIKELNKIRLRYLKNES